MIIEIRERRDKRTAAAAAYFVTNVSNSWSYHIIYIFVRFRRRVAFGRCLLESRTNADFCFCFFLWFWLFLCWFRVSSGSCSSTEFIDYFMWIPSYHFNKRANLKGDLSIVRWCQIFLQKKKKKNRFADFKHLFFSPEATDSRKIRFRSRFDVSQLFV